MIFQLTISRSYLKIFVYVKAYRHQVFLSQVIYVVIMFVPLMLDFYWALTAIRLFYNSNSWSIKPHRNSSHCPNRKRSFHCFQDWMIFLQWRVVFLYWLFLCLSSILKVTTEINGFFFSFLFSFRNSRILYLFLWTKINKGFCIAEQQIQLSCILTNFQWTCHYFDFTQVIFFICVFSSPQMIRYVYFTHFIFLLFLLFFLIMRIIN